MTCSSNPQGPLLLLHISRDTQQQPEGPLLHISRDMQQQPEGPLMCTCGRDPGCANLTGCNMTCCSGTQGPPLVAKSQSTLRFPTQMRFFCCVSHPSFSYSSYSGGADRHRVAQAASALLSAKATSRVSLRAKPAAVSKTCQSSQRRTHGFLQITRHGANSFAAQISELDSVCCR